MKNDPNEKITQIDENYPNLTQIQKWPKYKNNPKSKMTQNLKKKKFKNDQILKWPKSKNDPKAKMTHNQKWPKFKKYLKS